MNKWKDFPGNSSVTFLTYFVPAQFVKERRSAVYCIDGETIQCSTDKIYTYSLFPTIFQFCLPKAFILPCTIVNTSKRCCTKCGSFDFLNLRRCNISRVVHLLQDLRNMAHISRVSKIL